MTLRIARLPRSSSLTAVGIASMLALSGCPQKDTPPTAAPTEAPAETTDAGFENPGGMWMPGQMTAHADTLKKLGVEFSPEALTDPTSFPLGAVVSLGGCSASFVSDQGLVITNHHCVGGPLQFNSTPEANLNKDGFLAKDLAGEKWAGPTSRIYVTVGFTDVTDKVLDGARGRSRTR